MLRFCYLALVHFNDYTKNNEPIIEESGLAVITNEYMINRLTSLEVSLFPNSLIYRYIKTLDSAHFFISAHYPGYRSHSSSVFYRYAYQPLHTILPKLKTFSHGFDSFLVLGTK